MMSSIRQLLTILFFVALPFLTEAQSGPIAARSNETKAPKPFKISATGKQVSIRGNKNIQSLMVWTADGHRIVEQKEINLSSYTFQVSVNAKVFFIMLKMDGKVYTEKIGL